MPPFANNSAFVTVVVVPLPLFSSIEGGQFQTWGADVAISLTSPGSVDPDDPSTTLTYNWNCSAVGAGTTGGA